MSRRISRERIVDAAIAAADHDGLAAVTMRRLAADLQVEAMSLYHYLRSRDELLEAIIERLLQPLCGEPGGRHDWQDYLRWLASVTRGIARLHPRLFPLVATSNPAAPWVRPPLRSLDVIEGFLSTLRRHGFSAEQTVLAYRSFTSFLLGQLLLEVVPLSSPPAVDPGDLESTAILENASPRLPDLSAYPSLTEAERQLSTDNSEADFNAALTDTLERIARLVDSEGLHPPAPVPV
jgi:TetR/AcrR family tetracycline transcriptional repressor